ncbi:hypothetical protein DFH27DRAFT_575161 [Peziza echinospora]|nr:hypothetical protein DFH27DRAFT_575161 [Peziza echinospora]
MRNAQLLLLRKGAFPAVLFICKALLVKYQARDWHHAYFVLQVVWFLQKPFPVFVYGCMASQ